MATTTTTKDRFVNVRYDRPAAGSHLTLADRNLTHYTSIVEAVNTRLQSVGKPWSIKPWQAAVAAEILEGRDVVVKAQTGSGKSMCYLALAITHPEDCMLVVCPLLALMEDQVQSATAFGIKAVQLSASTIKDNPKLVEKVRQGEFSMVLVSAEFTSSEAWKSLVREDRSGRISTFSQSLRRIVIDEAHLVREWSVLCTAISNGHIISNASMLPGEFSGHITATWGCSGPDSPGFQSWHVRLPYLRQRCIISTNLCIWSHPQCFVTIPQTALAFHCLQRQLRKGTWSLDYRYWSSCQRRPEHGTLIPRMTISGVLG
jgi:hypothetical protein